METNLVSKIALEKKNKKLQTKTDGGSFRTSPLSEELEASITNSEAILSQKQKNQKDKEHLVAMFNLNEKDLPADHILIEENMGPSGEFRRVVTGVKQKEWNQEQVKKLQQFMSSSELMKVGQSQDGGIKASEA